MNDFRKPRVLLVGDSGMGKTTSLIPNNKLGVKGLNPETTFILQCAGSGKDLPMRGWRKAFKADLKPQDGGNFFFSQDIPTIGTMLKGIAANRKDIETIVLDDLDYSMSFTALKDEVKMEFDEWRVLGTRFISRIIKPLLDHPDFYRLNIIFIFHVDYDRRGEPVVKTSGNLVDKHINIPGLFSTVLHAEQVYSAKEDKYVYRFHTSKKPGILAKTLPGCFPDDTVPNDMGLVLDYMNEYANS